MKRSLVLLAVIATQAMAVEPPKAYNHKRYSHLCDQSIITDEPLVEPPLPEENDLKDLVLMGSKKTPTMQMVIIVNTKDHDQRITIPSKEASEQGFAIRELKQNRGNFMRTEALLQKGKFQKWVKYDPKFLSLKKGGARKFPGNDRKRSGSKNTPPIPWVSIGQKKTTPKKRARVRYVPKPKK